MISAVWGLAVNAVEGAASTDFYQVAKSTRELERSEIADKDTQVRPRPGGGIAEIPVPEPLRRKPCLGAAEVRMLVDAALRLEEHYGYALDIEWAIENDSRLFILQARPLRKSAHPGANFHEDHRSEVSQIPADRHPVLLAGGASACDGVAAGRAYLIESDHMLHHVPEGVVLVARQTSPQFVPIMGRIRGIVTDVGSVTGHMASVAREFRIPSLVGTVSATRVIPPGEEITVDAAHGIVYRGFVEALVQKKAPVNPMKGSPAYKAFQAALKRIAPLNLTDPKNDNFRPEGCKTLHDVIRFAHEMAMQEMFSISSELGPEKKIAVPLKIKLPLNLYIVDLGGGIAEGSPEAVTPDQLRSIPLKAVLRGMSHPDVDWSRDAGIHVGGFASILAESILHDPIVEGQMGGPNYAVISEQYLNLSSRLGYHFSTIDAYCSRTVNDNYITFHFKGGAADVGRRTRRAMMITGILKRLGFKVDQKGDMVRGGIKKYGSEELQEKLDMLGRLLGSVRLLDMVLSDDRQIEWYVEAFLKGNYAFDPE
jgi:pyruvate,water dikinase